MTGNPPARDRPGDTRPLAGDGDFPPEWLVLAIALATVGGLATTATVLIATGTGYGVFACAPAMALLSARPAIR